MAVLCDDAGYYKMINLSDDVEYNTTVLCDDAGYYMMMT